MLAINNQLDIDIQQVFHNIGYGADYKLPARILSLVDEYVENVPQLIEPSYSCVIRDIKVVRDSVVVIEGAVAFQSEVIARLLERCEKVAVFVLTIGSYLEEMVCRLAEDGLMLQATVLDAIGSIAVEKVADFVQGRIGEVTRARELCMSRRFSPGYCDWAVDQQRKVFQSINGNSAGIRLTEGCLMIPRKSVSGIIGIGTGNDVEDYNPCKTCSKDDCPWGR